MADEKIIGKARLISEKIPWYRGISSHRTFVTLYTELEEYEQ